MLIDCDLSFPIVENTRKEMELSLEGIIILLIYLNYIFYFLIKIITIIKS